jgi:hypothetical protein
VVSSRRAAVKSSMPSGEVSAMPPGEVSAMSPRTCDLFLFLIQLALASTTP